MKSMGQQKPPPRPTKPIISLGELLIAVAAVGAILGMLSPRAAMVVGSIIGLLTIALAGVVILKRREG